MVKEGIIPCCLNDQPSNTISNMGDGANSEWSMAFQHSNDIMQVEAPSSTISWCMPLLYERRHDEEEEDYG
jgi:hypothetical protein